MSDSIYLIQDNGQLVGMTAKDYDSEDLLQKLLADYPNLLAGEQINSTTPRQWLLVSREMGVPSEENGNDKWSLDHLFLDQDGIPTLVEVKQSKNTQIRREVVGQMLDYAANGVAYWPVEKIIAKFEAKCEAETIAPEQKLVEFFGIEIDPEQFWEQVQTNLKAGKVRLVFVADKIPAELQRIVEFLNKQMNPAEVLAIEIKQYAGQALKCLVPRVIGQTAEPIDLIEVKQWDESSFFKKLEKREKPDELWVAQQIYKWSKTQFKISWSKGKIGSFYVLTEHRNTEFRLFSMWAGTGVNDLEAMVQFDFATLKEKFPFDDEGKRLELLQRLNNIPDVNFSPGAIKGYPYIRLYKLKGEMALNQFFEVCDWIIQEIKAS